MKKERNSRTAGELKEVCRAHVYENKNAYFKCNSKHEWINKKE